MATRLKIDLTQGILEVEGSETFVKNIYHDFKAQFLDEEVVEAGKPRRRSRKPHLAVASTEPTSEVKLPEYNFIQELDVTAGLDYPSLVDFMDSKFPFTNEERNLVFIYYMQDFLKQKPITIDHLFTCYRKAKIRVPLNLEHSLQLTVHQKKWMQLTKTGHISVTSEGKQYLDKQLPKKTKS
jgi:hypothetical protein